MGMTRRRARRRPCRRHLHRRRPAPLRRARCATSRRRAVADVMTPHAAHGRSRRARDRLRRDDGGRAQGLAARSSSTTTSAWSARCTCTISSRRESSDAAPKRWRARARVRLLTCDVDGVLTDGRIYVDDLGHEMKAFSRARRRRHAPARRAPASSSRGSPAAPRRPSSIARAASNVAHVLLDVADKLAAWNALRERLGIAPEACAHIGDDLPDVPVMRACGFAVTVPHAPAAVREHAHYVTRATAATARCASSPSSSSPRRDTRRRRPPMRAA